MAQTATPADDRPASDLARLIDQHEATDWSEVPGVSSAEAAAWTTRLIEARDAVQTGDADA